MSLIFFMPREENHESTEDETLDCSPQPDLPEEENSIKLSVDNLGEYLKTEFGITTAAQKMDFTGYTYSAYLTFKTYPLQKGKFENVKVGIKASLGAWRFPDFESKTGEGGWILKRDCDVDTDGCCLESFKAEYTWTIGMENRGAPATNGCVITGVSGTYTPDT